MAIEVYEGVDVAIVEKFTGIKTKVIDVTIDQDTMMEATDWRKSIVALKKKTDDARKAAIEPLKSAITETEAPYIALITELERVRVMISGKMDTFLIAEKRKEEKRLEEAKQKQLAELAEQQARYAVDEKPEEVQAVQVAIEHAESAPVVARPSYTGFTGASSFLQKRWVAEIVDENLVPRQYCQVHMPLINAAIKKSDDPNLLKIPGVIIKEIEESRTR